MGRKHRFVISPARSRLDELLKIAANNDQRTEAHAYIGLDLRIKNRPSEAKPHFEWSKEFGNANFVEYTLAIAELSRFGG